MIGQRSKLRLFRAAREYGRAKVRSTNDSGNALLDKDTSANAYHHIERNNEQKEMIRIHTIRSIRPLDSRLTTHKAQRTHIHRSIVTKLDSISARQGGRGKDIHSSLGKLIKKKENTNKDQCVMTFSYTPSRSSRPSVQIEMGKVVIVENAQECRA